MTPSPAPPDGLQRAPLDIYKKIAVVRSVDDTVSYEDSQGRQQTISGLGNEAISAVRWYHNLYSNIRNTCLPANVGRKTTY